MKTVEQVKPVVEPLTPVVELLIPPVQIDMPEALKPSVKTPKPRLLGWVRMQMLKYWISSATGSSRDGITLEERDLTHVRLFRCGKQVTTPVTVIRDRDCITKLSRHDLVESYIFLADLAKNGKKSEIDLVTAKLLHDRALGSQ